MMLSRLARKKREQGFMLFEMVLVTAIALLFAGTMLERFQVYQEMAEKAAMEQTVGSLRAALNLQMAGMITRGRTQDIPKLVAVNPFQFLTERQKNYAGEFYDVSAGDVPTGSWYYDLKTKEVVYLVHNGKYFVAAHGKAKVVRYKPAIVYNDLFRDQSKAPSLADIGGVALQERERYQWTVREKE